jgi:transposase
MLRRLQWFAAGLVAGALGSLYGLFRMRQARRRVVDPEQLVETVGAAVTSLGRGVRDAWDESRDAVAETEAELRADYLRRRPHLRDAAN